MGNTFKFWLIANINTILTVIIVIMIAIRFFTDYDVGGDFTFYHRFLLLLLVIGCPLTGIPSKKVSEAFVNYLLSLAVAIILAITLVLVKLPSDTLAGLSGAEMSGVLADSLVYTGIVVAVSWLPAGLLMPFVNSNINEIVSRSMRFRNSNVDLFEFKWKYLISIFMDISRALSLGFMIIRGIFSSPEVLNAAAVVLE